MLVSVLFDPILALPLVSKICILLEIGVLCYTSTLHSCSMWFLSLSKNILVVNDTVLTRSVLTKVLAVSRCQVTRTAFLCQSVIWFCNGIRNVDTSHTWIKWKEKGEYQKTLLSELKIYIIARHEECRRMSSPMSFDSRAPVSVIFILTATILIFDPNLVTAQKVIINIDGGWR